MPNFGGCTYGPDTFIRADRPTCNPNNCGGFGSCLPDPPCATRGSCTGVESTNGLDDNCSGDDDDDGGSCENARTDPVHVGTGAFTVDPLIDVRFEGSDVPIEFSRRFDSMDGWNHDYDRAFLVPPPSHEEREAIACDAMREAFLTVPPPSGPPAHPWLDRDASMRTFDYDRLADELGLP